MARHYYLVLTSALPGREAELEAWYDDQHIGDLVKVPGVVCAQRFHISSQVADTEVPQWTCLAIYELECDDPEEVIGRIAALAGSDAMPITGALSTQTRTRIVAQHARTALAGR